VCGALFDATGSYTWGFWFAAAFCAGAAAAAATLMPPAQRCLVGCACCAGCAGCGGAGFARAFGGGGGMWAPGDDDVLLRPNVWTDNVAAVRLSLRKAQSQSASVGQV
jgi:hypothetical protein